MLRILTTRQSAHALLAISDYFSEQRALSSLWLARPKEWRIKMHPIYGLWHMCWCMYIDVRFCNVLENTCDTVRLIKRRNLRGSCYVFAFGYIVTFQNLKWAFIYLWYYDFLSFDETRCHSIRSRVPNYAIITKLK